jgi:hypothetical protein
MHVADGRAWEMRVDASRAAAAVSADEMIACLGSHSARWEIAAMIQALSQHPWLNTPAETQRLGRRRCRDGELEVL